MDTFDNKLLYGTQPGPHGSGMWISQFRQRVLSPGKFCFCEMTPGYQGFQIITPWINEVPRLMYKHIRTNSMAQTQPLVQHINRSETPLLKLP